MDFSIGEKILIEFSTFGDRFLSVIANIEDDGRLLVYSPINNKIVERFKTDTFATVKYAHEGRLMGFSSRVLNNVDAPGVLIELAKPKDPYEAEERKEPRCLCRFPAIVVEGNRAAQAVVEDMSVSCSRIRFLNGGLVPFLEDLERNVQLTFHPFDLMEEGYSIGCVVKNAFIKDGKRYAILEFNKDENNARRRIANFIEGQVCCGIPRI